MPPPTTLAKSPDDDHSAHISRSRAEAILSGLDLGDWSDLIPEIAAELAEVYGDGIQSALPLVGFTSDETINEARALFGLDPVEGGDVAPSIVNQVNERSIQWAQDHAAELVSQLEENTRDQLRATIVSAIEEGWGADKLAGEISDSAGFSDYRSEAIARTEIISANNQGALASYRETGVANGKSWLTAGDDLVEEDCEANEAQGAIPLDEDFDSSDDAPPAHVNCRCTLIPEFLDENTGDEE
jgi:SPP1 gp7 family putative phage head morphogenesis protein